MRASCEAPARCGRNGGLSPNYGELAAAQRQLTQRDHQRVVDDVVLDLPAEVAARCATVPS